MNEVPISQQIDNRDAERLKSYRDYLDFYQGQHWEGRVVRGEKRLTFNYARVFIDKITSYLMSGMKYDIEPRRDSEKARVMAQRAENALYDVHRYNNLDQLDLDTEVDCAILGDACYKVIWDEEAKQVRVSAPDIQGIYAWWRGDDISRVWRVASKYSLAAEEAEPLHGVKSSGKTASIIEVWTDSDFELWLDNIVIDRKPNPYGFIPFLIYPNLREPKKFWGISDLPQIIEPQRELNRAMSQLSRILELSGNPIAVLENVNESEDIAVRPGAVWNIPEDAKAYLLDLLQGGGVSLHLDYINLLYRILHDISESPRAVFGGTERDLSGVALELEMQPLLQKVERKRIIRAGVYARRGEMILRLLKKYRAADFDTDELNLRVLWAPVLPQDVSRLVADEQAMVQMGVHSRRRAMSEIGVDNPEQEFARWLEERGSILRMNREFNARARGRGKGESDGVDE